MRAAMDGVAQTYFQLGRVAQFLGDGTLLARASELLDGGLVRDIEAQVADVPEFATKVFANGVFDFRFYRIVIYALVRSLRPASFVETGVLHGLTSAFILDALARNGRGKLVSVDLPSYPEQGPANRDGCQAVLPSGREPGWAIPPRLRDRWDLHLGASLDVLPSIIEGMGGIDMFCHDSDHTYDTMWGELVLGWNSLRPGGVLICDNIDMCPAFFDFTAKYGLSFLALSPCDAGYLETVRFAIVAKERA